MFSMKSAPLHSSIHTITVPDGRQFQADKFILCTGGRSRRLDFPGEEYALTHTDLWSLKSLPRTIVIVGGAATGCQLASIFSAFGAQVTLLERGPRLLRIEDESVADAINQSFLKRGIQIITEIDNVNQIEKNGQILTLSYTKQNQLIQLEAEAVFFYCGWETYHP
jgi:dihydrolipoamide dehydrogenase